jgi:hypothetical protein
MKAKHGSSDKVKKIIYYVDEGIVFVITILAIVFSDVIKNMLAGNLPGHGAFHLTWVKLLTSSFITVMLYGAVNNSFKYNDKDKPSMFKRIYVSVMLGLAWKEIVGATGIGG